MWEIQAWQLHAAEALAREKLEGYRREAQIERWARGPSLRQRLAHRLRAWAARLDPEPLPKAKVQARSY
ncbi:hypothetical protein Marky_1682 [Marinithermus hydrothermalis DSM 14884]|uniref:Uncharacterized protein n=2 Tax=Marinithermus TaxID=186191 RepID=F2NMN3_MARHT|nr:hypothetical protein Marky_1682 [Marinithermus hydrothermalis DSM 14884]